MDKDYKLTILELILTGYNKCRKDSVSREFNFGICYYMRFIGIPLMDQKDIFRELHQDHIVKGKDIFDHWFPCYIYNYDFEKSMTPRIQLLQRTIARLKEESN